MGTIGWLGLNDERGLEMEGKNRVAKMGKDEKKKEGFLITLQIFWKTHRSKIHKPDRTNSNQS